MDIRVPSLGEGIESGNVVSILVSEGDKVEADQTLIEIETEKAVAPLPSPQAGTVEKIHIQEGAKIAVGQVILTFRGSQPAPSAPQASSRAEDAAPRQEPVSGRRPAPKSAFGPPAGPAVRKLARDHGVDLFQVTGSARGGRITLQDVKRFVEGGHSSSQAALGARKSIDFSKFGSVTEKPLSSIRQKIGDKMVESWTEIPHVTQFADADITELMELRKKHADGFKAKGAALTVTVFAIKIVLGALKKYPQFNSSLDEATGNLVFKKYHNIGIAVDTDRGLLVPVLKDVGKKSLSDLGSELAGLAQKTRDKKVTLEDLQGGTFTISNLGGIGGGYFTPIINKPDVAILGIGRGSLKPVWTGKSFEPRMMLPLALSYDHRVIDGADGARFITEIVKGFENFDEGLLKS